jgi:DNA-binding FrmR family transcriptional regulator
MNESETQTTASAAGHAMPVNIQAFYPDHKGQLSRLAKIDGQIRGITRMIEERRYCIDIVVQIKAVQAALKQVQMGVLEKHIHHCVSASARTDDPTELGEKIEEIVQVIGKMD